MLCGAPKLCTLRCRHHDSLQDLSQDLSAIADFFSEQYYDGQDHDIPMLDKMKRVVYMINHIGPSSNKKMLQKELVPDVTSLVSFMRDSARGRAEYATFSCHWLHVMQEVNKMCHYSQAFYIFPAHLYSKVCCNFYGCIVASLTDGA